MKSLMQIALTDEWGKLPPVLQAHYRHGALIETGHMDIEYPRFMQRYLDVLRFFGALVNATGQKIPTIVEKTYEGDQQLWKRTFVYPNGKVICFKSALISAANNQLIEFVNPLLGLQMKAKVVNGELHYSGIRYVLKLGRVLISIPEWLALGHTTIVETAVDDIHFSTDFRLTHPLFGQIFRYAGLFKVDKEGVDTSA